jgi:hypothetical protein
VEIIKGLTFGLAPFALRLGDERRRVIKGSTVNALFPFFVFDA